MPLFRPYERIDEKLVAVALNEAFIAILDQEGQLRLASVQAELITDLQQVLELHSIDVVYWHVKDLTRM